MAIRKNKAWFINQVLQTVKYIGAEPRIAFMHPADICELLSNALPVDHFIIVCGGKRPDIILAGVGIYSRMDIPEGGNPIFLSSDKEDFPCCFHA